MRVDQIVRKAMQRLPDERYQSATEMAADLEAARAPLPTVSQCRVPAMNAGLNRPDDGARPGKSPGGLMAALGLVALLVADAIYLLKDHKMSVEKPVAQTCAKATSARSIQGRPGPLRPANSMRR